MSAPEHEEVAGRLFDQVSALEEIVFARLERIERHIGISDETANWEAVGDEIRTP